MLMTVPGSEEKREAGPVCRPPWSGSDIVAVVALVRRIFPLSNVEATPLRFNPAMATPRVDPSVRHANSRDPRPMALVRGPFYRQRRAYLLSRFRMSFVILVTKNNRQSDLYLK